MARTHSFLNTNAVLQGWKSGKTPIEIAYHDKRRAELLVLLLDADADPTALPVPVPRQEGNSWHLRNALNQIILKGWGSQSPFLDQLFTDMGLERTPHIMYRGAFMENGFETAKIVARLSKEQLIQWGVREGHVVEFESVIRNLKEQKRPVERPRSDRERSGYLSELLDSLNLNPKQRRTYYWKFIEHGYEIAETISLLTAKELTAWGILPGHVFEFVDLIEHYVARDRLHFSGTSARTRSGFLVELFEKAELPRNVRDEYKAKFIQAGFEVAVSVIRLDSTQLKNWSISSGHILMIEEAIQSFRPKPPVEPPKPLVESFKRDLAKTEVAKPLPAKAILPDTWKSAGSMDHAARVPHIGNNPIKDRKIVLNAKSVDNHTLGEQQTQIKCENGKSALVTDRQVCLMPESVRKPTVEPVPLPTPTAPPEIKVREMEALKATSKSAIQEPTAQNVTIKSRKAEVVPPPALSLTPYPSRALVASSLKSSHKDRTVVIRRDQDVDSLSDSQASTASTSVISPTFFVKFRGPLTLCLTFISGAMCMFLAQLVFWYIPLWNTRMNVSCSCV